MSYTPIIPVVNAMLSALGIKDMETAIDMMEHGGHDGTPFHFRDLMGCGCCAGGPADVWYDSWDESGQPAGYRERAKTWYRYLSDEDYKLRVNPDYEEHA